MDEIWKNIENFEGYYQISNFGRVKSLARQQKGRIPGKFQSVKEKILKLSKNRDGYLHCIACKDRKEYHFYVHRIVAKAFLQKIDGKICVNHKDGNKNNNSLSNLEWCSYGENMKHSYQIGLR